MATEKNKTETAENTDPLSRREFAAQTTPAEIKSPFLDKSGAAVFLGISVRCLEVWMKKRLVPFSRCGRTLRFHPQDLETHVRTKLRVV